ncbi:conjugal transfer protein [Streptomyces sp. S07_1.15]|uniref:conjugal transfer protein n=1 Tax=Streptomyces sp. S07_1.15 TaxID=2873925 RepID=UPI001D14C6A4|nr:conjugal transfer protein [Streptomyces sp. S07_1.15]MCC3655864.1 conjugal transfer protein [Streptomyces sp. S07_1.15]
MAVGRCAVWTALAAGPAALALTLTLPQTPAQRAAHHRPAPPATAAAADPSGWAEVFLAAWLRADDRDQDSPSAVVVRSIAPEVELPRPGGSDATAGAGLDRVAAVHSRRLGDGEWSVTLAAQYANASVRYFSVPVLASGQGQFTVSGGPARVAAPGPLPVPKPVESHPVELGRPLAESLEEFFAAYLADAGTVDRYLAPRVRLAAAGGYKRVELRQVAADREASKHVPDDGVRARVRVRLEAEDAAGVWPLEYRLRMSARGGRWEVAALQPAAGGAR